MPANTCELCCIVLLLEYTSLYCMKELSSYHTSRATVFRYCCAVSCGASFLPSDRPNQNHHLLFRVRSSFSLSLSLSLSLCEIPAVCERKSDVPSVRASISSSYQKKSSFFFTYYSRNDERRVCDHDYHSPTWTLYHSDSERFLLSFSSSSSLSLSIYLSIYFSSSYIREVDKRSLTTYCTTKTRKIK